MKYNIPAPKGPRDASVAPQPVPKREAPSALPIKESVEPKATVRAGDRSRPRSPRANRKERGARNRRSRCPRRRPQASSAGMVGKGVYEERMGSRLAGEDSKRSSREKCKNCFIGLGTHVPKHNGRSCQDLGNRCYLPRSARDCGRRRARHWARDCPNRAQLNGRSRRPTL